MQTVGDIYREAGVAAIYLLHGTFVGDDALGLWRTLGQFSPEFEQQLGSVAKQIVDALTGDKANYTVETAQRFERAIARDRQHPIPVRLFNWSGQNNHIGRAAAAVQLMDELNRGSGFEALGPAGEGCADPPRSAIRNPKPPTRILLWGHSHGGNALALLTNLLAADRETLDQFFTATRSYFCWPMWERPDLPLWQRVWETLRETQRPIDRLALDIVTFGTPIRYGWDTGGCSHLLHFVNHRPCEDLPPYLAKWPPRIGRLLTAYDGDYVNQIGIAGTNFPPALLQIRTLLAEFRLNHLLQAGVRKRDLLDRLRIGARVPEDGTTLLVNYGPGEGTIAQHAVGHAVYTQMKWLLFHAEEVVRRFYFSLISA